MARTGAAHVYPLVNGAMMRTCCRNRGITSM
jgi:hypothetical protein